MPARKYLYQDLIEGEQYEREAVDMSDGAADAGEIVALNDQGILDPTIMNAALTGNDVVVMTNPVGRLDMAIMPVGLGLDITELEASEDLTGGDLVNIHFDTGVFKVRRASASNNRPANGFVEGAVTTGEIAQIYREGTNAGVSGLTAPKVFLSITPGGVTSAAPTGTGVIQQCVGVAHAPTAFYFESGKVTHLA